MTDEKAQEVYNAWQTSGPAEVNAKLSELAAIDPDRAAELKGHFDAVERQESEMSQAMSPALPSQIAKSGDDRYNSYFADQLSNLNERYLTATSPRERAEILSEADHVRVLAQDANGIVAGSLYLEFTVVGNLMAAKTAVTGVDEEGNELSTGQRVASGVCALMIGMGGESRTILKVTEKEGAEAAENAFKTTATDFAKGAEGVESKAVLGGTDDIIVASKPSSSKLTRNIEEATGVEKSNNEAAHHIVAGSDPRAQEARDILSNEGIDINDADNGVFLPKNKNVENTGGATIHSTIHTNDYYEKVIETLRNAEPGTARDVLKDIGEQLKNGSFGK